MKILIDSQISAAEEMFGHLGRVELFKGRSLTRELVKRAQVLIVRSVTRVNKELLDGSQICFVGSATSGQDHVDVQFLEENGIEFFSAAGSNAKTVAEHVLCCIYDYASGTRVGLDELSVGLVGYGNVGRAVGNLLEGLSIRHLAYDPFLSSHSKSSILTDLDSVIGCDVVSLHVPLTSNCLHPTRNFIDEHVVSNLRSGSLLINTARGDVIDEGALIKRVLGGDRIWAAIDCWTGEPNINADLAQDVWRGTPHIAGHSVQAKNRASLMVYQRLCDYLKIQRRDFKFGVKEPSFLGVEGNFDVLDILNVVHPLRHHTEEIIKMSQLDTPRKVAHFDEYRAKCGLRQEFSAYKAVCSGFDGGIIKTLTGLGFFS